MTEGTLFLELEEQKIKRRTRPENFRLEVASKQFHNLSDIISLFLQRYLILRKIGKKPAINRYEENNVWKQ